LGYVIDVYRGQMRASRNFVDVALFVAFFPQLVAGPIERASHMLSQFARPRRFDAEAAQSGVALIIWGLFKKVVIADSVAVYADRVFLLEDPGFALLWAGVFAFGIQIYADFSAYSDIARGSARLLGIDLVRNFRHPYLARSPSDFWRRWHISLSMWFRDYVYIPLGGSRRTSKIGNVAVLFVTFAATGLWHGASWTFVLWGLIHATAILAHRTLRTVTPPEVREARAMAVLGWAATFLVVLFGWLTFRETDAGHLMHLMALNPLAVPGAEWREAAFVFVLVALYSIPLWVHAYLDERTTWLQRLESTAGHAGLSWLRTAGAVAGSVGIALLGADSAVPFIYFQF
jgi:D-alanyl-lipoteichoic acid acyltransferase DltB (MBOAT superfamily)